MVQTTAGQPSFEDLGEPLSEVTFCVVDLETTGAGPDAGMTEIGAVKVRGGRVLGEFQTLVRPASSIPALIQVLTGITNAMVADAPTVSQALPPFMEFAAGCVLVAHNAPFDIGFLKRAHEALGTRWPGPPVLDTVAISRQVLLPDEVPNHKLATLAAHFATDTTPDHRALSDARATVDVLHGLLGRAGSLGVHTLTDLQEFTRRVSPDRRAKRVWAKDAPSGPGLYWFVHEGTDHAGARRDEVLYVGRSQDVRTRVRAYFSAAERRSRIHEMVRVATGLRFLRCSTRLESEVRELRMIASLAPRYNRRSRNQARYVWLRLTDEAFPRLSVVRKVTGDAMHWGPFPSAEAAGEAALVLQDTFGIRQCTKRLSRTVATASCALAEMGRCHAPCELGDGVVRHQEAVENVRKAWGTDARPVLRAARGRLVRLVEQERFEEAGEVTARLTAFYDASVRHHRIRSISSCAEIVAAAPEGDHWAVHVIRYGRLAGAATAPTSRVVAVAQSLPEASETVLPPAGGIPAGSVEEAERIAAWLESPGVRLISTDGDWAWPLHAAMGPAGLATELTGQRSQPLADFAFQRSAENAAAPAAGARGAAGYRRRLRPGSPS